MQELRFASGAVLRPKESQLIVGGRPATIGGRAFDVLLALAERPGEVVTKRELMDRAWPDLVVEENNLQVQISTLRRVLGAASIITVAGRGYRLVAQPGDGAAPSDGSEAADGGAGLAPLPDADAPLVPLLERQDALAALQVGFDAAMTGGGSVCLVYGEAGIGKSSLCHAFLSGLKDVRVLRGGCEALFSPRPLGPLHDFVGQLDATARRLLGQDVARAELFAHVLGCLQQRPTVLLFEDLHWADEATLDFVKFVGRRIRHAHLLMMLTYRDDELAADHPLRQVIGDLQQSVRRIGLRPLSQAAVQEMARQAGRPAEGILATTGGNPFYVTELLEAGGLPATVRDAVQARVARQGPAVKALLELTSTVPGRVEHWIVEALVDPDGTAVQEALSSGLLESDADTLRFRHELARLAVEQSIAPHQLRRLHTRMLECLQSATDRAIAPARLAHHAKAAGRGADVLRFAQLAADEATRRGAYREAAALCESALPWSDRLAPQERARILESCGWAHICSNNVARSLDCFRQAWEIWKELDRVRDQARTLCRMSRCHWYLGASAQARQCARDAAVLVESMPDSPEYLEALAEISRTAMLCSNHREAIDVGTRAIAMAEQRGDEHLLAQVLNNVGTARFARGDEAGGRALLERSLALATRLRDADAAARGYTNLICQLVEARRYEHAQRLFDESASSFFVGYDLDVWENYSRGWRARVHFECGLWDRAQSDARAVLDRYYPSGSVTMRIPAQLAMAHLKIARGDADAPQALDEALDACVTTGELQRLVPAATLRAEFQWLHGRRDDALSGDLRQLLSRCRELELPGYSDELAYWLWQLGEAADAPDPATPFGMQVAGRWQDAAQAWRRIGCPLEEGRALLRGDRPAIERAARLFESLGAGAYLALVRKAKAAAS